MCVLHTVKCCGFSLRAVLLSFLQHPLLPVEVPWLCSTHHCEVAPAEMHSFIILTMCGVVNKKVTGGKLAPCNNHMHELSTAGPSVSVLLLKTVRVCVCVCVLTKDIPFNFYSLLLSVLIAPFCLSFASLWWTPFITTPLDFRCSEMFVFKANPFIRSILFLYATWCRRNASSVRVCFATHGLISQAEFITCSQVAVT